VSETTFRIALLGCGTVGSCVARALLVRRTEILERTGVDLQLDSILVRDLGRDRGVAFDNFTDSFDRMLAAKPDVVIELIGGSEPAAAYIRRALEAGCHVVTANKTAIARHGRDLERAAARSGVRLEYEAAVCAAVPILSTLRTLRGQRVYSLKGIVNGSTNYILSRMDDNGVSMTQALTEARELGLVEPDPSADLSGRDAAEKLCIIARHLGAGDVAVEDIDVCGIDAVTTEDVLFARRHGFALRLVAEFSRSGASCTLRVGPALIHRTDPLARIEGADNGVVIQSPFAGDLFLSGRGAGPQPTTGAILGDVILALTSARTARAPATPVDIRASPVARPHTDATGTPRRFFIRTHLGGRATPAALFDAFRQNGIALKQIEIANGAARALTHPTTAGQVRRAVGELRGGAGSSIAAPVVTADGHGDEEHIPVADAAIALRRSA